MANVLAHLVLGVAAAAGFAWLLARSAEFRARMKWAAAVLFAGAALGAALAWTGALFEFRWLLWAHIVVSFAGVLMLIPAVALAGAEVGFFGGRGVRGGGGGHWRGVAESIGPHPQSAGCAGFDGRGRRRAAIAVLALLGADERGRHGAGELLHGLEAVRRVPQGHLPAVGIVHAPLRVVQQPVLPEVD
jgi:hypothetical protein